MRTLLAAAALALAMPAAAAGKLTLTSTDVRPNGTLSDRQVFNGMGCTGANVSPQLAWQNPPQGTKSFVVTVYDPDAPADASPAMIGGMTKANALASASITAHYGRKR